MSNDHTATVADVRRFYGDYAAALVADGWTVDAAISHARGECDRAVCTGHGPDGRPAPAPATYDDDTLGACGCVDYHLADCPTRTGDTGRTADDWYARLSRPGYDEYYDGYDA